MSANPRKNNNQLTAMMPVRNEANRSLKEVLDQLTVVADRIVILDDASTDETPALCASYRKVILHRNEEQLFFQDEAALRARLWELAVQTEPDWILGVDADELFEDRIYSEINMLINQAEYDGVEFRIFDFWNGTTHYRVDRLWNPWVRFSLLLARYFPGVEHTWPVRPFHCGRWPLYYRKGLITFQSDIRVKHFGWVRAEERCEKYRVYKAMDPEGRLSAADHLESVLAPSASVVLEEWFDVKSPPFE